MPICLKKWEKRELKRFFLFSVFPVTMMISPTREDEGAATLKKLKRKLENSGGKAPDFLLVIIATGYAHKRDDGVYVVPVGSLRY